MILFFINFLALLLFSSRTIAKSFPQNGCNSTSDSGCSGGISSSVDISTSNALSSPALSTRPSTEFPVSASATTKLQTDIQLTTSFEVVSVLAIVGLQTDISIGAVEVVTHTTTQTEITQITQIIPLCIQTLATTLLTCVETTVTETETQISDIFSPTTVLQRETVTVIVPTITQIIPVTNTIPL